MRAPVLSRWLAAAGTAAAIGALAGCGSTRLLDRTTTATTVTAQRSAVAAMATTVTATTVTVSGTTTSVLPGTGRPPILLGDMNTPEQFIIGALYQDALEAQGYPVQLSRNIGATAVSQAALTQGSLDIYPEYLNVYLSQVAADDRRYTSLAGAFAAAQSYATANGQELLTPTPFSDSTGIAVLSRYARAHRLHSIGDLRRVQDSLTLGAPLEYVAEPDGLPALERAYHFTPAVTALITLGDQYAALRQGTLAASYVQTSDWELSEPLYTDLRDTKHVLGFGNVVPVVSAKTVAAEGPAFAAAINRVDALLTTSAIRGLAAEMASSTDPAMSASEVAKEFLEGYGIVPSPSWSTVTVTTPSLTTTTPTTTTPTTTTPTTTSSG